MQGQDKYFKKYGFVANIHNKATLIYHHWKQMKLRIARGNSDHGPRAHDCYYGLKVCNEWLDYPTFRRWMIDNGFKPGLSLDRIDNSLGYFPGNCRLIPAEDQAKNRGYCYEIPYHGKTLTLKELSEETGIAYGTLKRRLQRNWPLEMLTLPLMEAKVNQRTRRKLQSLKVRDNSALRKRKHYVCNHSWPQEEARPQGGGAGGDAD